MNESVQKILTAYKKKFGDLRTANDIGAVEALPTGFHDLDEDVLSIGGLPRGRIVELFGPESSGKSALCQAIVAKTQKDGGICAWVDAEGAFDIEWAEKFGVDLENLLFPEGDFGEQVLHKVEGLIAFVDLIVIDSLAEIMPEVLYKKNLDESTRLAARAALNREFIGDLVAGTDHNPRLKDTGCCIVFINQLRDKFGVVYGDKQDTPGGWAVRHNASVRLEVRRIKVDKEDEKQRVRLRCKKSKVGPPFRECELWLQWSGSFDEDEKSLLDLAVRKGLVEVTERGGWISSSHFTERIQGVKQFVEYCEANPEFQKMVED